MHALARNVNEHAIAGRTVSEIVEAAHTELMYTTSGDDHYLRHQSRSRSSTSTGDFIAGLDAKDLRAVGQFFTNLANAKEFGTSSRPYEGLKYVGGPNLNKSSCSFVLLEVDRRTVAGLLKSHVGAHEHAQIDDFIASVDPATYIINILDRLFVNQTTIVDVFHTFVADSANKRQQLKSLKGFISTLKRYIADGIWAFNT